MKEENIKKTILIVDDDPSILKMLVDKLTREDFNVLQANDGEEGLIMCKDHPDLILLDIIMPKMDGLSMMKKLRKENKWGKNVPIILLTNLSPDDDKINNNVTEDMPAYYLLKPNWGVGDVVEKVRERLNIV